MDLFYSSTIHLPSDKEVANASIEELLDYRKEIKRAMDRQVYFSNYDEAIEQLQASKLGQFEKEFAEFCKKWEIKSYVTAGNTRFSEHPNLPMQDEWLELASKYNLGGIDYDVELSELEFCLSIDYKEN